MPLLKPGAGSASYQALLVVLLCVAIYPWQSWARQGFTQAEKTELLAAHNKFRRSSRASDMTIMEWNNKLQIFAEQHADKCVFEHSSGASRKISPFGAIGENLYKLTSTDNSMVVNLTQATTEWYNEIKYYSYNTDTCQKGQMCGHYTQVVWASSYSLGCAINKCKEFTLLVCEYGPAGNYRGKKPYIPGKSCSRCKKISDDADFTQFCLCGLCSKANHVASDKCSVELPAAPSAAPINMVVPPSWLIAAICLLRNLLDHTTFY